MHLKITFFLPTLEGGGAEKNAVNILKELGSKDYDITLLLAEKRGVFLSEMPQNIKIKEIKSLKSFLVFLGVLNHLKLEKPDIFVSTFPRFNLINIFANIIAGNKTKILLIEQTTPSLLFATAKKFSYKIIALLFLPILLRIFYQRAWKIVAVSGAVKSDLEKIIGKKKQITLIYNPVVDEKIIELSKEKAEENIFSETSLLPVVITCGRLVKAKDYPTIINAFVKVLKKRPAYLAIMGQGEEEKETKKLVKSFGIKDNIVFLGFKSNPYKYFSKAAVFVSSSVREGFSNSIVEAMACGVPVVSTKACGPKEIITDGVNGVLVEIGDVEAMAKQILNLLDNKNFSNKIIEAAKVRAKDFAIKNSVQKYEEIFAEAKK